MRPDNRITRAIACFCAALAAAAAAAGPYDSFNGFDRQEDPAPKELATARLLADVQTIEPGKPFTVGVLLDIRKDWHVYWKNPGQAGLATTIQFDLPKGFAAGQVQWPVPIRFEESGGILSFGYADEVMLLIELTPARDLKPGSRIKLSADVSFLACKERCIPGKAACSLTLTVGKKAVPADPATRKSIARWQDRLPRPAKTQVVTTAGALPPDNQTAEFRVTVDWKKPVTDVLFFPVAGDAFSVDNVKVRTRDSKTTITFRVTRYGKKPPNQPLETVIKATCGKTGETIGLLVPVTLQPRTKSQTQPTRNISRR